MLRKIFLAALVLLPSAWMNTVSWQYGLGAFVLLFCLVAMASLIRGSVQVVREPRGRTTHGMAREEPVIHPKNLSQNVGGVSGLDSSVFKRFQNQHHVGGSAISHAAPPGPYQASSPPNQVSDTARSAVQTEQNAAFLDELEDSEQIRVSLSSEARTARESGQQVQTSEPVHNQFAEEPLGTGFMKGSESRKPMSGTASAYPPNPPLTALAEEPPSAMEERMRTGEAVENAMPNDELDVAMENLFEDVRIPLKTEQKSVAAGREETGTAGKRETPVQNQPTQDFWNEEDFSQLFQKPGTLGDTAAEAEGLLKLAISSAEAGKSAEARTGLDEYLSMIEVIGGKPDSEALRLESNLRDPETNEMTDGINPPLSTEQELAETSKMDEKGGQTDYAVIMDELVSALEEKQAFGEALPLLQDLLSYNRQQSNPEGMDRLYLRIEQAYIALGDQEQLIQTLLKHLELTKELGEKQGESRILEALGTSYANAGNLEMSRRYHQENIKIQAELKEESDMSAGEPALQ